MFGVQMPANRRPAAVPYEAAQCSTRPSFLAVVSTPWIVAGSVTAPEVSPCRVSGIGSRRSNTAANRGSAADPVAVRITGPNPSAACASKVSCHSVAVSSGQSRWSTTSSRLIITAAYTGVPTSP